MAIWYIWYQVGIKSQMKRTTAGLVITERAADSSHGLSCSSTCVIIGLLSSISCRRILSWLKRDSGDENNRYQIVHRGCVINGITSFYPCFTSMNDKDRMKQVLIARSPNAARMSIYRDWISTANNLAFFQSIWIPKMDKCQSYGAIIFL